MKLVIFNGSPRNKKSNSKLLIEHFLTGYGRSKSEEVPFSYLANRKEREQQLALYNDADVVLIVFPLYTDCMPGIVKEFLELVHDLGSCPQKTIGFVVQSGFPEGVHSVYVERYLKKFVKRLNAKYLGTIIKGGVEGIQIMPQFMTKKLFAQFEQLGEHFAETEEFDPKLQDILAKPYRMSPLRVRIFRAMNKTGLTNFYWNSNLKKNNAFEERNARPFEPSKSKILIP